MSLMWIVRHPRDEGLIQPYFSDFLIVGSDSPGGTHHISPMGSLPTKSSVHSPALPIHSLKEIFGTIGVFEIHAVFRASGLRQGYCAEYGRSDFPWLSRPPATPLLDDNFQLPTDCQTRGSERPHRSSIPLGLGSLAWNG